MSSGSLVWFCLTGVLAVNQNLKHQLGIKLCARRCFTTGYCCDIELDSGLRCQLKLDKKMNGCNSALRKLHPDVWKSVPHTECELNHRLVTLKTGTSACISGQPILTSSSSRALVATTITIVTPLPGIKGRQLSEDKNCKIQDPIGLSGSYEVGMHFDPVRKKFVKACQRYSTKMRRYKGYNIHGYNLKSFNSITLEECEKRCIAFENITCKSFDYGRDLPIFPHRCCLSGVGYFDVCPEDRKTDKKWILGVRDCQ